MLLKKQIHKKMARVKTNKVHCDKDGVIHEVSREKKTNKFFIKNTQIEVTAITYNTQ